MTCSYGSVFSAAILVLRRCTTAGSTSSDYCLWIRWWRWSCVYSFLNFTCHVYRPKMDLTLSMLSILREFERQRRRAVFIQFDFCCVKMVPIDSASNDDSNGGQFVFWSILDLWCQNLAPEPNLAELITFSPHFWPIRSVESRPMTLIIRLIDRAHSQRSKTPLIVIVGQVIVKISAMVLSFRVGSVSRQQVNAGFSNQDAHLN